MGPRTGTAATFLGVLLIAACVIVWQQVRLGDLRSKVLTLRKEMAMDELLHSNSSGLALSGSSDAARREGTVHEGESEQELLAEEIRMAFEAEDERTFLGLLPRVQKLDLAEIGALLQKLDLEGDEEEEIRMLCYSTKLSEDPGRTLKHIFEDGGGLASIKDGLVIGMMNWLRKDADEAIAWYDSVEQKGLLDLPDAVEDVEEMKRIIEGMIRLEKAKRDPVGSIPLAVASDRMEIYGLIRQVALGLKTDGERKQLLDAIAAGKRGEEKLMQYSAVAEVLVWRDGFDAAAACALSVELPQQELALFISEIAKREMQEDPAGRIAWILSTLPDGGRSRALEEVVKAWAYQDHAAAASWINAQEKGLVRDTAAARFAELIAGKEPESATDWALSISDREKRAATLDRVFKKWNEGDSEAAKAYFAEKGIEVVE